MKINIEKLKQEYGEEFSEQIMSDVDFSEEKGLPWNIKINRGLSIDTVIFVNTAFVKFYRVSRKSKRFCEKSSVTISNLVESLMMANELREDKNGQEE